MPSECPHYNSGACRSCELLALPPSEREARKEALFHEAVNAVLGAGIKIAPLWSPAAARGSRGKAKLSVSGTLKDPVLGLVDRALVARELIDCPLHRPELNEIAGWLKFAVTRHKLAPYHIERRQGELKGVILRANEDGSEVCVRLVLRSRDLLSKARALAAELTAAFARVKVVSVNIQGLPAALLEGPEEIVLTEERYIRERFELSGDAAAWPPPDRLRSGDAPALPASLSNNTTLLFPPQAFAQVTHETAQALYSHVGKIAADCRPARLLDLFCGVGGFSFACAPFIEKGVGVELSESAVAAANEAAAAAGLRQLTFVSRDAREYLAAAGAEKPPELLVTNPPRRGLGEELALAIAALGPRMIAYSSCNPETLLRDLAVLRKTYELVELAPFDMFPWTRHLEVVALLRKS